MAFAARGGDVPLYLFLGAAAASPSLSRMFLVVALEAVGMPLAVVRLVAALYSHILMYILLGGLRELGVATSGVAQGCPLSGASFLLVMDPLVRVLHRVLVGATAGLAKVCADDVAALLRAARCAEVLLPGLALARLAMGLKFTMHTCHVVPPLAVGIHATAEIEVVAVALPRVGGGREGVAVMDAVCTSWRGWGLEPAMQLGWPLAQTRAESAQHGLFDAAGSGSEHPLCDEGHAGLGVRRVVCAHAAGSRVDRGACAGAHCALAWQSMATARALGVAASVGLACLPVCGACSRLTHALV